MKTILMKTNNTLFVLVLFLSLSATVFSQNPKLDSLKIELKTHIVKDSTRVNLLNAISHENNGFDQEQMKQYADKANILAKDIGFIKGEARSWYLKGLYYLKKRELDSTRINIDQSLSLEKKRGNNAGISECYNIIATIYRYQEDYKNSILFYHKRLQIAQDENNQIKVAGILSGMGATYNVMGELDDAEIVLKQSIGIYDSLNSEKGVLFPLNNLALVYTQQGRHTEALSYFQRCLTGYRNEDNNVQGSIILLNMALVYSSMDQNDKALPYLKEGLEVAKELGDELQISKFIIGIGYCHKYNKEYDKALEYYSEGLAICEKINSKQGLYNCYNNIGGLHIEREEYDLALINYKKGLEVSLASSNKVGIAGSYTELGVIYFELGNYEKALENALKGKEIADEISLIRTQAEANRILSQLYEKEYDYKEGLERFKDYKMYSDSLFNKERIEKITSLEYEYKYQQQLDSASIRELTLTKSVKTTSLKLEKSQEKYLWSIIGFLIVFMVLAGVIVYLRFRNIKSKTQNIVMEQKLLRSQMTPHFIFNSLSVLQGMILIKEEKKSITYLSKFSKLLRIILENSRDKTVSLEQELSAIENYLALQILEDNGYHYQVDVEADIDVTLFEIPAMLIQPFAENSIEHAFPYKDDNKLIDIHISFVNNKLICTITDNGIGINSQKQLLRKDKKSLATTITSERLKILSKDFKIHGEVTIVDRQKYNEEGTVVTLEIPYKLHKTY
jgi:tetratricopeptide (TPR) repeat protein